jgi:uncharacterized protein (TIGR03067 family)
MNRHVVFVLSLCLVLTPVLPRAVGVSANKDDLQGKWILIEVEKAGESHKVKPKSTEFFQLEFKANQVTTIFNGSPSEKGTYKTDTSKKPRTIDFMPTTGDDKGKTLLGIYEVKGGKLKLCVAEPEVKKRPTKFESKSDDIVVYVLERVKE